MVHGLTELAAQFELGDRLPALGAALAAAVHITTIAPVPNEAGRSRLGGEGDLPPGFAWPERDGRPLAFLGQFDCADLPVPPPGGFPASGLLSFFYDVADQPWGLAPDDEMPGGHLVCHFPIGTELVQTEQPEPLVQTVLPRRSLAHAVEMFLPSYQSLAFRSVMSDDSRWSDYSELCTAVREALHGSEPEHQLGGPALNLQGDMQVQCELAFRGIFDDDIYEDPRMVEIEAAAEEWVLLLQVASDDDLEVMWGDEGLIYFWIRSADLASLDFSKVQCILQSN